MRARQNLEIPDSLKGDQGIQGEKGDRGDPNQVSDEVLSKVLSTALPLAVGGAAVTSALGQGLAGLFGRLFGSGGRRSTRRGRHD